MPSGAPFDDFAAVGADAFAVGTTNAPNITVYDLHTGAERWHANEARSTDTPPDLVATPTRLLLFQDHTVVGFGWDQPEPLFRTRIRKAGFHINLSADQRWLRVGDAEPGILDLQSGDVTPLPASAGREGCLRNEAWYGIDGDRNLVRVNLTGGDVSVIGNESVRDALRTAKSVTNSCGWLDNPDGSVRLVFGTLFHAVGVDIEPDDTSPHAKVSWQFDFGVRTAGFDAGRSGTDDNSVTTLPWFGALTRYIPIPLRYDSAFDPAYDRSLGDHRLGIFDARTGTLTEGPRKNRLIAYRAFRQDSTVFARLQLEIGEPTFIVSIDGDTGRIRNAIGDDALTTSALASASGGLWSWCGYRVRPCTDVPLLQLDDDLSTRSTLSPEFAPPAARAFATTVF